jgi:hypothetical protein
VALSLCPFTRLPVVLYEQQGYSLPMTLTVTAQIGIEHRTYRATFTNDREAAEYVAARAAYTTLNLDTSDLANWPLTTAALHTSN